MSARVRELADRQAQLQQRCAAQRASVALRRSMENDFNRAVAQLYELTNVLNAASDEAAAPDLDWALREAAEALLMMMAPMMPHLAEECWVALGHTGLVATAAWPTLESELLVENTITLPVQINGRKRADVTVPREAANADIEAAVLALDAVKRALDGKPPKKVIIVPQRIVNVVA